MINLTKRTTRMDAILSLEPDAKCFSDGRVEEPQWPEGYSGTIPTEAEIDAEVLRLENEWTAQEYARSRKAEYDALNQLEMQFDDKEDGTTTWEDAIVAIKTKYPKG